MGGWILGVLAVASFFALDLTANAFTDCAQKVQELQLQHTDDVLVVSVSKQELSHFRKGKVLARYPISTAKAGIGAREGSYQTPLGLHRIKEKIGGHAPLYGIFEARQFTGRAWNKKSGREREDMILTRILRLEGLERGVNAGCDKEGTRVDSFQRYIYIHGTNHEKALGTPSSQGCVRMFSTDIVELYANVPRGSLVWITN